MSSAKQLNLFEENKLQALPKKDLPQFGRNVKMGDRLYYQPSEGQKLWQELQYELFLRYQMPSRLGLDAAVEIVQQRHDEYYRRFNEQIRRLRQGR